MSERPLHYVPKLVLGVLACALAAQIALKATHPVTLPAASDLRPPPSKSTLRLVSLGDPIPVAKLLMLYLQSYDYRAMNRIPYKDLNYDTLEQWLGRILWLDPKGQYPLLAASRLYADIPNVAKDRKMLKFIYKEFSADPNRRWRWLADAAVIAKHRLHDLPLAEKYAAAIQKHATGPHVPQWAKQMEIFILEDMNELQRARIMIGGLLASGTIHDPSEIRFLAQRLKRIEARMKAEARLKTER